MLNVRMPDEYVYMANLYLIDMFCLIIACINLTWHKNGFLTGTDTQSACNGETTVRSRGLPHRLGLIRYVLSRLYDLHRTTYISIMFYVK